MQPSSPLFVDWTSTAAILITIVGSVWTLAWWLSNQFRDVRALVYSKIEQLQKMFMEKLEYHERHDDQRFHGITNDLWTIKIRNAAKDGETVLSQTANTEK